MPTNYNILLKSEKKLKKIIIEYLDLVHKIHLKLWDELGEFKSNEIHFAYDNVERRIKKAILMEEELIDECIWTISKDDPRANHLRFIISVIYSAKDLTRASEYAQTMAKIIMRKNFNNEHMNFLKPISKLYLETIEKSMKIYASSIDEKAEKFDELNHQFEVDLEKEEELIREKLKESSREITYINISQITRLINSTIERIKTIFPSTIFVKSTTTSINTIKNKK